MLIALTWMFTIRQCARFETGCPVDAADSEDEMQHHTSLAQHVFSSFPSDEELNLIRYR